MRNNIEVLEILGKHEFDLLTKREGENYSPLEEKISQKIHESESFIEKAGSKLNRLKEQYFKPKSFEKNGRLYEKLGVRTFKKFLPTFGDYVCRLTGARLIKGKKDLKGMDNWTKIYETVHVIGGSISAEMTIDMIAEGNYAGAASQLISNLLVNIYPIMTQRYNRSRLHNAIERMENKTGDKK